MAQPPLILHASAVAVAGQGLLILGPSGSGKSAFALQMMALGADLVADDRVAVARVDDQIRLGAPPNIDGLIEARFLGLLHARPLPHAPLAAVLDLARQETERLPPRRVTKVLDRETPLIHAVHQPYFPSAMMQFLKGGRTA